MKDTISTQDGQKRRNKLMSKSVLIPTLVTVFVLSIIGSFTLGYSKGHKAGQEASAQALRNGISDLINPINALSKNPLAPNTLIGKVDAVAGSKLTVKLTNGSKKTVIVNNDTKITKSGKSIKLSEVSNNTNITVFTQKQDSNSSDKNDPVATRVIVR